MTLRILFALSFALIVSGCSMLVPSWTYRYRLTVEVYQDGQLRTGSSVIEVWRQKAPPIIGNGIGGEPRGEAVAIDLGSSGTLFALLRNDWPMWVVHNAFNDPPIVKMTVDERALDQIEKMQGHKATLMEDDYPQFIRFRDVNDPRTAEEVDPLDLSASFGPGVWLSRITVEITDDPVTEGLETRLKWLHDTEKYRKDPANPFTSTLPSIIQGLEAWGNFT